MMSGMPLETCWAFNKRWNINSITRLYLVSYFYWFKHVEPSISVGIINSITRLHLVGYFYWIILRCTDPWILKKKLLTPIFTVSWYLRSHAIQMILPSQQMEFTGGYQKTVSRQWRAILPLQRSLTPFVRWKQNNDWTTGNHGACAQLTNTCYSPQTLSPACDVHPTNLHSYI